MKPPPTASAPSAGESLQSAQSAEATAQATDTDAQTKLSTIEDEIKATKTSLATEQAKITSTTKAMGKQKMAAITEETAQYKPPTTGSPGQGSSTDPLPSDPKPSDPIPDTGDVGTGAVEGADKTTGGLTATGEDDLEKAATAEVAGGGPEDPVSDILAGGLAFVGAITSLVGMFKNAFVAPKESKWEGIDNANNINDGSDSGYDELTNVLGNVFTALKNPNLTAKQKQQLTAFENQIQSNQQNDRPIVVYTPLATSSNEGQQQPTIAFQLSPSQIQQAIKAYQQNPDVFKDVDPQRLEIMGLNPSMAFGKSSATLTPNGYIPSKRYDAALGNIVQQVFSSTDGTNYASGDTASNYYLSSSYVSSTKAHSVAMLNSIESKVNSLSSATPAQQTASAQTDYINKMNTAIAKYAGGTGQQAQLETWLKWKLASFQYSQGLTKTDPGPEPTKPLTPTAYKAIQAEQADLATYQAKVKQIQSTLQTDLNEKTTDQTALTTADKTLASAQTALTNAQAQATQAKNSATTYDQNLATTISNAYAQQYYNNLQSALENNTAFNPDNLIDPTSLYNQMAISGSNVVAPKEVAPKGIQFVNGVPQILASAVINNPVQSASTATTGVAPPAPPTTSTPSSNPTTGT